MGKEDVPEGGAKSQCSHPHGWESQRLDQDFCPAPECGNGAACVLNEFRIVSGLCHPAFPLFRCLCSLWLSCACFFTVYSVRGRQIACTFSS